MTSIFERDEFTRALFFPRRDASRAPHGASDAMIGGVHVRTHPAPDARCTILLFHGNGEVVADYDEAAPRFARAGARLAVAEYRGYGQSEGEPSLRAIVEDARPIAESIAGPLIVMGRSLGGLAAHELYARPTPNMIGVVLESTLSDLAGLIRRRGLVPPPLTEAERTRFDPAIKLPLGRLPLLILHGEADDLIVPAEARATLEWAGSARKTLRTIPLRGHNDVSLSPVYWEALRDFVATI